ncbi:DUF1993 domain-containing protein [Alishewanella tabrizica]|uniref:DUF1993 domain-containing protein n=1 Tax=Alishewanella tabrizica TaxID=671278 RepID=A0ABQ2WKB2_9ALTE|nr:DUF1993 domain-containing protein [Alishewanella tabrizica]GGW59785.1 hypothetical protein GCM10008111_14900 [Alishewanella tabrizica]
MFYELSVVQATKMLHNLTAILAKGALFAESKKIEMSVLLNARLAPDQFPLLRQVQIACDTAKLGAARLTGKVDSAPKHADDEHTLAEIQHRIAETITYLASFSASDFNDAATQRISQPRWEGKYLTGDEFLMQHVLPNLYFHITTAYAILRHNGVDVGKKDYLGAMPYKV